MFIQNEAFYYNPIKSNSFSYFYYVNSNIEKNPDKTIRQCFSVLYNDGLFLKAIYALLVQHDSVGEEGCYWYYTDPDDPDDPDEAKLGKVCFAIGFNNPNWTVYVSEETSFEYAKKACERFLEIHPEHEAFLKEILRDWKPA